MKQTHKDLDLSSYARPRNPGNRGITVRVLWFLISALIFQSRLPLLPSSTKSKILRLFGAVVGRHLVLKPRVIIKYPWFLELGDNVWIGEAVWIDNPQEIKIGSNVCISQGAYLVTGNHDFKSRDFRFFASSITIEDKVWICAGAVIPPGAVVPANTVVPMSAVWRHAGI